MSFAIQRSQIPAMIFRFSICYSYCPLQSNTALCLLQTFSFSVIWVNSVLTFATQLRVFTIFKGICSWKIYITKVIMKCLIFYSTCSNFNMNNNKNIISTSAICCICSPRSYWSWNLGQSLCLIFALTVLPLQPFLCALTVMKLFFRYLLTHLVGHCHCHHIRSPGSLSLKSLFACYIEQHQYQ